MGWASKGNLYIGKIAATGYVLNKWRLGRQTSGENLSTGIELGHIWGTQFGYMAGGLLIKSVAYNPVTATITFAVIAGAITADTIDEEEGLDNYWGFGTGGLVGNDPNYLSGDENDSGYFNFFQNTKNVIDSNKRRTKASFDNYIEQRYIDNYFAERNWTRKLLLYDALTQEQKNLVQQKIRSGDYEGASQIL